MRRQETGTEVAYVPDKSPYEQPASDACIMAHLARTAIRLPLKGVNRDSPELGNRQAIEILKDYTQRLMAKKVTEVDLVIALEWFVENGKSDFFPTYAKLNAKLFGRQKDDDVE